MSKRKRDKMKQKAARHRPNVAETNEPRSPAKVSEAKPNVSAVTRIRGGQPHLASASSEWKEWYAAVSKVFGG